MIVLGQRLDSAATYAVFVFTLVLLCITGTLALKADAVYVDGVKVPDSPPGPSAVAVTNIVNYRLLSAIFGSTGITNVWTGAKAAYDALPEKDNKTLYFTQE